MATKTKTFDCAQMKRRAQEKLRAEYKARKSEFSSLEDFLNEKADASATRKALRAKGGRQAQEPESFCFQERLVHHLTKARKYAVCCVFLRLFVHVGAGPSAAGVIWARV